MFSDVPTSSLTVTQIFLYVMITNTYVYIIFGRVQCRWYVSTFRLVSWYYLIIVCCVGLIWNKITTTFDHWEVELTFKVAGRGRVGADGLVSVLINSLVWSSYHLVYALLKMPFLCSIEKCRKAAESEWFYFSRFCVWIYKIKFAYQSIYCNLIYSKNWSF